MQKIKIILIISFIILSTNVFSQSEIWKINGTKIITDTLLVDTSNYVLYKNKRNKTKYISKDDVFSVSQNNQTIVFYIPDTIQDSFTVEQMQAYLQGKHDGYKHKSPLFFSGGVLVGLSTPIVFPIAGLSGGFIAIPPALYTVGIGIPKIKEKNIKVPSEYKNDENYILGYQTAAKKRRITNTIIGSVVGLAVGVSVSYFVIGY